MSDVDNAQVDYAARIGEQLDAEMVAAVREADLHKGDDASAYYEVRDLSATLMLSSASPAMRIAICMAAQMIENMGGMNTACVELGRKLAAIHRKYYVESPAFVADQKAAS